MHLHIHFPNLTLLTYIEILLYKLFLVKQYNRKVLIIGSFSQRSQNPPRRDQTQSNADGMGLVGRAMAGFLFWLFHAMLNIFVFYHKS